MPSLKHSSSDSIEKHGPRRREIPVNDSEGRIVSSVTVDNPAVPIEMITRSLDRTA
jgi:hypothetical protein